MFNSTFRYMDHMPSVSRGAEIGINECKRQFKDNRWNCSSVKNVASDYGVMPNTGKINVFVYHRLNNVWIFCSIYIVLDAIHIYIIIHTHVFKLGVYC